ncbi:MAG: hypothetical protein FWF29_10860, partial [Treponema sp.]|nr:hypothetical protein [Treponema sp.]
AAAPERANIQYHRINKILKDSPWRRLAYPSMVSGQPAGRSNIYLAPRNALADSALAAGAWETIFRRFLDAGFLLPPVPGHPLILPGIMSPGEEAKLAMLLQEELPA